MQKGLRIRDKAVMGEAYVNGYHNAAQATVSMNSHKHTIRIVRLSILLCAMLATAQDLKFEESRERQVTSPEMLNYIIERTITEQDSMRRGILDMQFLARSEFREMDDRGDLKKELLIERIVYEKGDRQATQYLSMSSNGEALDEKQMAKEITSWEKQGKRRGTTKMPFDPQYRYDYGYTLNGWSVYEGHEVMVVGFVPSKDEDGYIEGIAYLLSSGYRVVRIEASPAKLPGVIKDMTMIYTYQEEQGYWLPATFEFSMRLKVQFVLTFVHATYALEDRYSQFVINSGLPDSLFAGLE